MNNHFKIFIILAVLLFLGGWLCVQFYGPFQANHINDNYKNFKIAKGEGLMSVATGLKEQGIIQSKLLFSAYVFLKNEQTLLKAGEYSLSPEIGIIRITNKIIKGETTKNKITIIEGWRLNKIAQYLNNQGIVREQDFLDIALHPQPFTDEFSFLKDKPREASLEGYLFPDTYLVSSQLNSEEVIKAMLSNLNNKLTPELREKIKSQGKTIFGVITMASILEKEVRGEKDKRIVSGIFWKRIANHYPLQSCATIAYVLGKDKWRYSVEDTKIDSPYNTYQRLGLPKGPICNPGMESIKAAIYPKKTNYWYYLSTPKGKTIFSRTLREHNIARAKYLK